MKPMQSFPTNTRQPCAGCGMTTKAAASAETCAAKKLETDLQIQLSKLEDLRVQA